MDEHCPICLEEYRIQDESHNLEGFAKNVKTTKKKWIKSCSICSCKIHTKCFSDYVHEQRNISCVICRHTVYIRQPIRIRNLALKYFRLCVPFLYLFLLFPVYCVIGWIGKLVLQVEDAYWTPFSMQHLMASFIGMIVLFSVLFVCSSIYNCYKDLH